MSAKAIAFVAFVLIVSGLLTGMLPVTAQGQECGSAFRESALSSDETQTLSYGTQQELTASCDDVRNLVRIPAIVLLVAGGLTMLAAANARWRVTVARS
ncbi:hypothetical protein OG320_14435 [Microbispora sp. NBC_01189]|uniref:hypothetical protein n=1 Tax=Microbispora sp. NBC_01189 TaxID=2903583 RepID=UPI002E0D29DC|nr:hypothetical protein OG320_14435 [Microbispora sp. NBC_01189]